MKDKINTLKLKQTIPKKIVKKIKNANYKIRYNNILKKYEELEHNYNNLKSDLERKNNIVKNLRKEIKKYNDFWGDDENEKIE